MERTEKEQPVQIKPQVSQSSPQNTGINKLFIGIAVVIIFAVITGGFFAYKAYKNSKTNQNVAALNASSVPKSSNNPVQTQAVVNSTAQDNSDAQINKDLQLIDNGLNNTDANAAAVDQGLSDKQTNLQ